MMRTLSNNYSMNIRHREQQRQIHLQCAMANHAEISNDLS